MDISVTVFKSWVSANRLSNNPLPRPAAGDAGSKSCPGILKL